MLTKKRVSPRRRYLVAVSTGLSVLWLVGSMFHYVAGRRRHVADLRALSDLRARVEALESAPSSSASAPSSSASAPSSSSPPRLSSRLLGKGRTGAWQYSDLRLPDGTVRRYYARTNSTPVQLLALLRTIREDMADSCLKANTVGPLANGGPSGGSVATPLQTPDW